MFGCITHQPRRNRLRNYEDEPPNHRSRSYETANPAETPAIKYTSRHSSLPAKPADLLKGNTSPPPQQSGSLRLDKWISHLLNEGASNIHSGSQMYFFFRSSDEVPSRKVKTQYFAADLLGFLNFCTFDLKISLLVSKT
ncbi:hypothetical protein RB195_010088 [Necator americanus]|uniref:Uncharacterized protein n=1 Tax=Necator americanus TaxID=51031 RepID=A0ABR1CYR9_NECAM